MVQAVVIERIDQRPLHMLLSDQFREIAGTPLARQDLITHMDELCLVIYPCFLPRAGREWR